MVKGMSTYRDQLDRVGQQLGDSPSGDSTSFISKYKVYLILFALMLVGLTIMKPSFVTNAVTDNNGQTAKKLNLIKVVVWSAVLTVGSYLACFLYRKYGGTSKECKACAAP